MARGGTTGGKELMRPFLSTSFVSTAIRIVIGGIFIYAGILKMMDPAAFAKAIESFRMVPRAFIAPLAIILPPLEVLAGALWIVNRASVAAATTILGLCVLFAVALGAAILRGLPTSCGCFGAALDGSSPKVALLRDIFFTAATAYWLVLQRCAPRKAR